MEEKTETAYYFSWARKGLGNLLSEADTLGKAGAISPATQRPLLLVTAECELTPAADGAAYSTLSETKKIQFVSPGDVASLRAEAILRVAPKEGSAGFPIQFHPYVEFWEADFPWRYTPARPSGDKLRPWLALLVCPQALCSLKKLQDGQPYVTLLVESNAQYEKIFPSPEDSWKSAHAQGVTEAAPEFSRLFALRTTEALESETDYFAFLVPAFETGRLRGLGYDDEALSGIAAQKPSWETNLERQKSQHPKQALDFPVYYSWDFKTGTDSFDKLVEKLNVTGGHAADIQVDVTRMGEGLDYAVLGKVPKRKRIGMSVATQPPGYVQGTPFPSNSANADEAELYGRLKSLLSKSPVFLENEDEISTKTSRVPAGEDDPWVVPPIYGGKHLLSTSLDEATNQKSGTPWLSQLNLDIHHRAAAGLGKRTVQTHQEEFVNRAWKQVEAINALNRELHQRLLSVHVNESLKGKTVNTFSQTEKYFIARMMQYLGSMKDAETEGETSLASILKDSHIPQAFASASFQHLTDNVAKLVQNLDTTSVMESIAERQTFKMREHVFYNAPTIEQLREATDRIYFMLFEEICKSLSKYFDFAKDNTPGSQTLYALRPKKITDDFDEYMTSQVQEIHNLPPLSYGPELVSKEHYKLYGFRLGPHPQERPVYTMLSGHAKDITPLETPCVLVIDDLEYQNLFGTSEKKVTQIGTEDGYEQLRCFIAQSQIKALIELEEPSSQKRAAYFETTVVYRGRTLQAEGRGGSIPSGRRVVAEADYDFETDKLIPGFRPPASSGAWVLESSNTLCYMVVDLNIIKKLGLLQEFPSMHSYVEFLKKNPGTANKYLNEWLQLDACVKSIEAEKVDKKPQQASINTEDAKELQAGFEDSEAYERMRQVAETYYAEFFGGDEQGQKLREGYIDELLHSKYPILAYPLFPEPVYHYLKMFSDKWIIPCVDALPEDSVALFQSNPSFVEAYLCGMNTEMGRELLWREYPTDQRGSYFRKFWDSETTAADIHSGNFFDIAPLHTWKGGLGDNHPESKTGLLLFALKGKLMRQYPSTQVFLQKAMAPQGSLEFDLGATEENGGIVLPVIQAFLREDILLVGFKREFGELLGNPRAGDFGYFLAFQEDIQDLNFQFPEKEASKEHLEKWEKADNAAQVAEALKNQPTLYGKHLSLFLP
ncbi:MAG: hypothetical protein FWG75_06340 [Cystobacterineae bacterium]|nr:hypothetical protein [Cystobacterineae bacterium]